MHNFVCLLFTVNFTESFSTFYRNSKFLISSLLFIPVYLSPIILYVCIFIVILYKYKIVFILFVIVHLVLYLMLVDISDFEVDYFGAGIRVYKVIPLITLSPFMRIHFNVVEFLKNFEK